jgi:hypothetical protein
MGGAGGGGALDMSGGGGLCFSPEFFGSSAMTPATLQYRGLEVEVYSLQLQQFSPLRIQKKGLPFALSH